MLYKFVVSFCAMSAVMAAALPLEAEDKIETTTFEPPSDNNKTNGRALWLETIKEVTNDVNELQKAAVHPTNIDDWEAPEWIQRNYPSYLSGHDSEGRPIWVSEWGKFDIRKIVESGTENMTLFEKYVERSSHVVVNSSMTKDNPKMEASFIIDMDGLTLDQFTIPTVRFITGIALRFREILESGGIHKAIVINANSATNLAVQLAKNILGKLFDAVDVYGTDKNVWIPRLLDEFPKDQLPEWYGGSKDHKPVLVYGK